MAGYYDIILGLIPVSLGGLTAVFVTAGMSFVFSIGIASIATLGLMGHAMFVNAPGHATGSTNAERSTKRPPNDGSSAQ